VNRRWMPDAGRLLFLKKICRRSGMLSGLQVYFTERLADEHKQSP